MHFGRFERRAQTPTSVVLMGHITGDALIYTEKRENITFKVCIQCFLALICTKTRALRILQNKMKLASPPTTTRHGKTNMPNRSSAFLLRSPVALFSSFSFLFSPAEPPMSAFTICRVPLALLPPTNVATGFIPQTLIISLCYKLLLMISNSSGQLVKLEHQVR